jgi:hypothetical protein
MDFISPLFSPRFGPNSHQNALITLQDGIAGANVGIAGAFNVLLWISRNSRGIVGNGGGITGNRGEDFGNRGGINHRQPTENNDEFSHRLLIDSKKTSKDPEVDEACG